MTEEHHDRDRATADNLFVIRVIDGIEYGVRMRIFRCGCVEIIDAVRIKNGAIVQTYNQNTLPPFVEALTDEYARVAQVVVPMRNALSQVDQLVAMAERAGADHTH